MLYENLDFCFKRTKRFSFVSFFPAGFSAAFVNLTVLSAVRLMATSIIRLTVVAGGAGLGLITNDKTL